MGDDVVKDVPRSLTVAQGRVDEVSAEPLPAQREVVRDVGDPGVSEAAIQLAGRNAPGNWTSGVDAAFAEPVKGREHAIEERGTIVLAQGESALSTEAGSARMTTLTQMVENAFA